MRYLFICLLSVFLGCTRGTNSLDVKTRNGDRMAAEVINFYIGIEYEKIKPFKERYSQVNFEKYSASIQNSKELGRKINRLEENEDYKILSEVEIFIKKGSKLFEGNVELEALIIELELINIASKIDNTTLLERQQYSDLLALNVSLVVQFMVDLSTSRTILVLEPSSDWIYNK